MDPIVQAQQRLERAREELVSAVDQARTNGRTWADIGAALGMSRQAAFKRFGRPVDPASGETISHHRAVDVQRRTEEVLALIASGDYEQLATVMHPRAAHELTADVLARVWRDVLSEVGVLEGQANARVELRDGSVLGEDDEVVGACVGFTTLNCEAGTMQGRVDFDANLAVTGILITPDTAD